MRMPSKHGLNLLKVVQGEIKKHVEKAGSLAKLAKKGKVSPSTLTRWLSGEVIPDFATAEMAVRLWGGDLLKELKGEDPRTAILYDVYGSDEEMLDGLVEIQADPEALLKLKSEIQFLASMAKRTKESTERST